MSFLTRFQAVVPVRARVRRETASESVARPHHGQYHRVFPDWLYRQRSADARYRGPENPVVSDCRHTRRVYDFLGFFI